MIWPLHIYFCQGGGREERQFAFCVIRASALIGFCQKEGGALTAPPRVLREFPFLYIEICEISFLGCTGTRLDISLRPGLEVSSSTGDARIIA